ncbi:DNA repair protein rad52, partial [Dinochytrium kinnereticum]
MLPLSNSIVGGGSSMLQQQRQQPFPNGFRAFTEEERKEINRKLKQCLGQEYMGHRPGPGGSKLTYLEGHRAIGLAHEIFGFDGWSHSIIETTIDYVDIGRDGGSVSVGMSVIIRVTLRDGTCHEDFGYGSIENARSKGAAFEKVRKEAVTDGIKRALRAFGNALGNCVYDKDYLKKVNKIPAVKPLVITRDDLFRGEEYFKPTDAVKPSAIAQSVQILNQIPAPQAATSAVQQ